MTKEEIIRKLTSRKLWLALAGMVSGIIMAFGGGEDTAATVSGVILQVASVIGYLLAEGLSDAAYAKAQPVIDEAEIMEGIDITELNDEQLREVLYQMGLYPPADATREELEAYLYSADIAE